MKIRKRKVFVLILFVLIGVSLTIPAVVTADSHGVHVVQRGETLSEIAKLYNVSLSQITAANSISNPNLIYSGQRLVLPGAGSDVATGSSSGSGVHLVQRGENLFRISVMYNVSMDSIVAANNIANANHIYTGQQLVIPGDGYVYVEVAPAPAAPAASVDSGPTISVGKQIVVDLSEQQIYAYQDGQLLRTFIVSTGLPATPTVQGDYNIYLKYELQRMRGPGYDLPNVPWVMYFYQGYGFHGTYWHSNFGQTMSHGCVNMRTPESEWLWNWAPMGTAVHVHA